MCFEYLTDRVSQEATNQPFPLSLSTYTMVTRPVEEIKRLLRQRFAMLLLDDLVLRAAYMVSINLGISSSSNLTAFPSGKMYAIRLGRGMFVICSAMSWASEAGVEDPLSFVRPDRIPSCSPPDQTRLPVFDWGVEGGGSGGRAPSAILNALGASANAMGFYVA
ncbi:hypothetical protein CROQUDRAFT_136172 [Cronartium quercuum f. sp. fusiforme G11]|uniref:Uncharacterized protein n=1 Tax=Cronartium quercuum f. sp. fusiforme G11 TaxID=708437 RepID=A0A9P6NCA3_9BASI|nr:hypothetical protein CROQUDRAFT_136172 [Cronartium quercuum f. sp. fusiforme G11]